MRAVKNALPIIDELLAENDKILFNLFYRIAESENAIWITDDNSYIIGQTNEKLPLWVWMRDSVDSAACGEVAEVIVERLTLNPKLRVTGDEKKLTSILHKLVEERRAGSYKAQVPMVIYSCKEVTNSKNADGQMILSGQEHKALLAKFITGMVWDLEKRPMNDGEAEGFANDVAGFPDMYLWEDGGNVASMAMVAHRTKEFARINTVYTDSGQRGKGYAGMLISQLTQKLLDEKRIPMLYTERDNVCSNATYKRVGYQVCGELTEFLLNA